MFHLICNSSAKVKIMIKAILLFTRGCMTSYPPRGFIAVSKWKPFKNVVLFPIITTSLDVSKVPEH